MTDGRLIATELGDAAQGSDHYRALFTLGILLFLVTFLINLTADIVLRRSGGRRAARPGSPKES